MRQIFVISLIITLFFSLIGSIMAFLIVYEEYAHHFADKRKPFRHAMQTAIFTFIIFLVLMSLAVLFLMRKF